MSEKKNLDEFLRDTLNSLPNTPVGDFKKVESLMQAKKHQSMLLLLLVPFVFYGLFWMGGFTEKDFTFSPDKQYAAPKEAQKTQDIAPQPMQLPQQKAGVLVSKPTAKKPTATVATTKNRTAKMADANYKPPTVQSTLLQLQANAKPLPETNADFLLAGQKQQTAAPLVADEIALLPAGNGLFLPETANLMTEEITDYDVRETSKVSVTLNLYPNYTFREFKINSLYQSQVNDRYEDIINASEKGGFAFNAGIDVRYHLGDNLFIGSGLGLIQTKISGSYNYEVSGEPVTDGNGNIYMYALFIEPFEVNQGIIQTYRFLQLPLHVSYQPWVSQKLRLIAEGGFSYIRFLSADGITIDHQSLAPKELNTMYFNKDMASMDFKIGLTYYPKPNVAVGIEPTLMYFSSSIYASDFPVYVVPWSVGININVRLKLY